MRMYVSGWRVVALAMTLVGTIGCNDSTELVAPQTAAVQANTAVPRESTIDESELRVRVTTPLQALPNSIADQICSLHRYTTEADLIARFGEASTREDEADQVSMMWKGSGWRLVAYWAGGELQVAGASADHPEVTNGLVALSRYPNELRIGKSTQNDVTALLGDGVQTAASWHHGIDIDADAAERNGVPLRAIDDHCNRRLTYVGQNNGVVTTLAFRDGVLDGGFDDE